MRCSDFEIRLCEYLDGTLDEALRRDLEQHASGCELCSALLADSRAVNRFLDTVEEVEAPGELVTSILYRTRGARPGAGFGPRWRSWFQHLLQPRYAMSMAMTILSVSMLYRVAGVQIRQLEVADLNPVKIWESVDNSAHRVWSRGVKFYQNVRFIYEVMAQWRALQADEEQAQEPEKSTAGQPGSQSPSPPRKLEPTPPPGRSR